jgi:hypothetical protein
MLSSETLRQFFYINKWNCTSLFIPSCDKHRQNSSFELVTTISSFNDAGTKVVLIAIFGNFTDSTRVGINPRTLRYMTVYQEGVTHEKKIITIRKEGFLILVYGISPSLNPTNILYDKGLIIYLSLLPYTCRVLKREFCLPTD